MRAADVETWDRAASSYGRQEHLEERAVARAVALADPRAGDRLLDVATGTGLVLRTVAARPGRPAVAIGIDRSPGMLARVGPLPDGWRVVAGDATALPWATPRFDVAVAAFVLHLLDARERAAVMAELHRVLAPRGRLVVVTVWSRRAPVRAALGAAAHAAPASLGGLRPHDPRAELRASGWAVEHAALTHRGYPSLVVAARRR